MALNPYYDAWKKMYRQMMPDVYQSYYQGVFPSGSAVSPTIVPQPAQVGESPMANQPSAFVSQFMAPPGTQSAYSYGQKIGLQPAGYGQSGQGQFGVPGHPVYDPYWQYWNPKTKSYQQEKFTEVEKGQLGWGFPDYGPPPKDYKYGSIPYYNPNGIAVGTYASSGAQTTTTGQTVVPGSPAELGYVTQEWYEANNPRNLSWEDYWKEYNAKRAYMQKQYGGAPATPVTAAVPVAPPTTSMPNTSVSSSGCAGGVCKSPAQVAWEQSVSKGVTPTYTTTRTSTGGYVTEAQKQALIAKGLWKPSATYNTSYLKSLGV